MCCPPARGLGRAASVVQPASCHLREADPPHPATGSCVQGGRANGGSAQPCEPDGGQAGLLEVPPEVATSAQPRHRTWSLCSCSFKARLGLAGDPSTRPRLAFPAASGRCWAIASLQPLVGLSGRATSPLSWAPRPPGTRGRDPAVPSWRWRRWCWPSDSPGSCRG